MTMISFTSGQILDIISALEAKENEIYDNGDKHLADYYMNLGTQFQRVYDRLQDLPGEKQVANMVLTA